MAARARSSFCAKPRVLVIGVTEQIVHARKLRMKRFDECDIAGRGGLIRDALVQTSVRLERRIMNIRRTEVKHCAESEFAADGDALLDLGRSCGDFFRRPRFLPINVSRSRAERLRQRNEVFQIERFVVGPRTPRDVQLHDIESEVFHALHVRVVPIHLGKRRSTEKSHFVVHTLRGFNLPGGQFVDGEDQGGAGQQGS